MCWCKAEKNLGCSVEVGRWQILILASDCTLLHYSSVFGCCSLSWPRRLWWNGLKSGSKQTSAARGAHCVELHCPASHESSTLLLSPLPWQPAAHKYNLIALCLSHTVFSAPRHPISPLLGYGTPVGPCLVNLTDAQTWTRNEHTWSTCFLVGDGACKSILSSPILHETTF